MMVAFLLVANNLFAQKHYMSINGSYNFGMGTQSLHYFDFYSYTNVNDVLTFEQNFVSLGKGFSAGLNYGYMFTDNIGVDLGVSFLLSDKAKAKDIYPVGTTDYFLSSKMGHIVPSAVFATSFQKVNPYAKIGPIIGYGFVEYEKNINDSAYMSKTIMKLNGGISLGLSSELGVKYKISEQISIFGQMSVNALTYSPNKGEVTKATYNEADILPDMQRYEREIEYVNSYSFNENAAIDYTQPRKVLKQHLPFGSIGVNAGIIINFNSR